MLLDLLLLYLSDCRIHLRWISFTLWNWFEIFISVFIWAFTNIFCGSRLDRFSSLILSLGGLLPFHILFHRICTNYLRFFTLLVAFIWLVNIVFKSLLSRPIIDTLFLRRLFKTLAVAIICIIWLCFIISIFTLT